MISFIVYFRLVVRAGLEEERLTLPWRVGGRLLRWFELRY